MASDTSHVMHSARTVTGILKRAAVIVAANWPVTVVQFVAEALFKIVLSIPIVGGAVLVAVLLGRDGRELIGGDLRDALTWVAAALADKPLALAAFLVSFAVVLIGGSAFMFLIKGGTVAVLLRADQATGAVEPLRLSTLRRASQFSLERFIGGCRWLFRRYLRLGLILIAVYALSSAAYLLLVFGAYRFAVDGALFVGWTILAGISSSALVVWITLVNLLYLLIQLVVAVENCSVRRATIKVIGFLRADLRGLAAIFGLVLVLVLVATVAFMLTTAGLGLIAFVPLAGLAVLPLQLAVWLGRSLVFQYLGLTALAAYLGLYRSFTADTTHRSRAPRPGASISRAS
jgi:hypothetical protein